MEDFVTFETAKKLKEKGFPQKFFGKCEMQGACYIDDGRFYINGCITEVEKAYTAPTISQVLKWLRVDRCFHVSPDLVSDYSVDADGNICEEWAYWSYSIHHIIDGVLYRDYNQFDNIEYKSYEEAAIAGIEYVLDNLI
jgi:hypothetical protein